MTQARKHRLPSCREASKLEPTILLAFANLDRSLVLRFTCLWRGLEAILNEIAGYSVADPRPAELSLRIELSLAPRLPSP